MTKQLGNDDIGADPEFRTFTPREIATAAAMRLSGMAQAGPGTNWHHQIAHHGIDLIDDDAPAFYIQTEAGQHFVVRVELTKVFVLDLPGRVDVWIDEENLGNKLLTKIFASSVHVDRWQSTRRLIFPAMSGVRAALDQLVMLVDGVRAARRSDRDDFDACQAAIKRLDVVYRELRTPWCDTCKTGAIRQEHPARWAHVTEEHPLGVPESLDSSDHEVTAREWNAT